MGDRRQPGLETLGEEGILTILKRNSLDPECLDIEDDVAFLNHEPGETFVISTDLLVEGVHFRRDTISPEDLGYKALAVNLSDLSAKGARPCGAFLSWALPPELAPDWVDRFSRSLMELAHRVGCPLRGGDTTRSASGGGEGKGIATNTSIFISMTVVGCGTRENLKERRGGRPSDILVVTGPLGDSAAGLSVLEGTARASQAADQRGQQGKVISQDFPITSFNNVEAILMERHRRPPLRLAQGQWLAKHSGVHAMMDLSDGLWTDLPRFAKASRLLAEVDCESIPTSQELHLWIENRFSNPAVDIQSELCGWAIKGGEDYELLCAVDPPCFPELKVQFQSQFNMLLHPVGRLLSRPQALPREANQIPSESQVQWRAPFPLPEILPFRHF